MRKIKFRFWDKDRQCFCKDKLHLFIDYDGKPQNFQNGGEDDIYELSQFTGLLDKNGKEIYEGDITQTVCGDGVRLSKFIIEWDEANCRFVKHRHDGEVFDLDSLSVALHEIIGNIYENPELLNQEVKA